jgi:hypothetical protein
MNEQNNIRMRTLRQTILPSCLILRASIKIIILWFVFNLPLARAQSNPVAWWQISGVNVVDKSTNNHPASVSGTAGYGFAEEIGGGFIQYNGASYMQIEDASDLDLPSDWTFSFWIKPGLLVSGQQICFNKHANDSETDGYRVYLDRSANAWNVSFQAYFPSGSYTLKAVSVLPPQMWSHVTITYDSASRLGKIYVNSMLTSANHSGLKQAINGNNFPLLFSAETDTTRYVFPSSFMGALGDVRIFSRQLTGHEVASVYRDWKTVSGTINYSGSQTGDIWVLLSQGTNSLRLQNYSQRLTNAPWNYSFTNVVTGSDYRIWAFRDTNGNGMFELGKTNSELTGQYAGNPVQITNNMWFIPEVRS